MLFRDAWWRKYTEDYYWFELTGEKRGEYLRAPLYDSSGKERPDYSLLQQMYPGDLVIHYDRNVRAIVGISRVSKRWTKGKMDWTPETKKKSKTEPNIVDAQIVKLTSYTNIKAIPLTKIRQFNDEISLIVSQLKEKYKSTYFAFSEATHKKPYVDPNQKYASVVNQSFVDLLPSLKKSLDQLKGGKKPSKQANEIIPPRAPVNQDKRDAVENYAFEKAVAYYKSKGYEVESMPRKSFPYDVKALSETTGRELHVEVKGLSGKLQKITLTHHEESYSKENPENSVLFIVSEIKCKPPSSKSKKWKCSGGKIYEENPWIIDDSNLKATEFSYTINN